MIPLFICVGSGPQENLRAAVSSGNRKSFSLLMPKARLAVCEFTVFHDAGRDDRP